MNCIKLFLAFFCLSLFFTCDNTLNVTDDWRNIPVIYALIDPNESINYIRIEKGFLDPEVGGETIARIPDSLYYGPEVQARITNTRNGIALTPQRVNLEDEGFARQEGVFATQPNIGYKILIDDLAIEAGDILRLELIDASDNIMTSAEAPMVGQYTIPNGQPGNPILFRENLDFSFGIRSDEQSAHFYDCRLIFNYSEENSNDPGNVEEKSVVWEVARGIERARTSASGNFQSLSVFRVQGQEFFQFLEGAIPVDENVVRNFRRIDLQYDAGGESLFNFINIGQANTGITSSQLIPSFTNFSGEAVGVFSSRTTIRNEESFNLRTESRDSLREGRFTRALNFN